MKHLFGKFSKEATEKSPFRLMAACSVNVRTASLLYETADAHI